MSSIAAMKKAVEMMKSTLTKKESSMYNQWKKSSGEAGGYTMYLPMAKVRFVNNEAYVKLADGQQVSVAQYAASIADLMTKVGTGPTPAEIEAINNPPETEDENEEGDEY